MEICQYDLYIGIGQDNDAERWFDMMQAKTDNFPRPNTRWFVDWFYPIYNQNGKAQVLKNFFNLLSIHFSKSDFKNGITTYPEYSRNLNFGEFVHFRSGAAGVDLKQLGKNAFGDKDEHGSDWQAQLVRAKTDLQQIIY